MEHGLVSALKTSSEETISADFYVLALPPRALYDLLSTSSLEGLQGVRSLAESHRGSPIITVYLWLKHRVWTESMTALLDSPIDWVFDLPIKDETEYRQRLSVVLSAARAWIDRDPNEILRMAVSELSRYRPGIDLQAVAHGRVVKDRRATVSLGPSSNLQRPEPETGCPNLFLAGDWIATGLPATMEGAALSGRLCAEALIARSGRGD
jgi:zeta-carotene desaturase